MGTAANDVAPVRIRWSQVASASGDESLSTTLAPARRWVFSTDSPYAWVIGNVVGARSAEVMPSASTTAAGLSASPEQDSRTVLGLPVEPDVASNRAVSAKMSPVGRCARLRNTQVP